MYSVGRLKLLLFREGVESEDFASRRVLGGGEGDGGLRLWPNKSKASILPSIQAKRLLQHFYFYFLRKHMLREDKKKRPMRYIHARAHTRVNARIKILSCATGARTNPTTRVQIRTRDTTRSKKRKTVPRPSVFPLPPPPLLPDHTPHIQNEDAFL